jgi:hypothetical protein
MAQVTYLRGYLWYKFVLKFKHRKLRSIEDLVAELAVSLHSQDFQVDIPA